MYLRGLISFRNRAFELGEVFDVGGSGGDDGVGVVRLLINGGKNNSGFIEVEGEPQDVLVTEAVREQ